MKKIKVKYKSTYYNILVDDSDYEDLIRYNLYIVKKKTANTMYCRGYIGNELISIHRYLMNPPDDMQIDFIDGNGLNLQRNNMRICTNSENQKNKKAVGKSKYLGVSVHIQNKSRYSKLKKRIVKYKYISYLAKIVIEGKQKHLGIFKTEIEAAKLYNEYAKKYHGEFARLNKID